MSSGPDSELRAALAAKIPAMQNEVKEFRKQYGATKVGEINVDMVSRSSCGGEAFAGGWVGDYFPRLHRLT